MNRKKGQRLPGAALAGGAGAAPTVGTPADRMRRFVIPAWPRTEPPGLSSPPNDEVVYFERKVRPYTSGTMRASELLRDIRETIARQVEGYFTLNEAAQVLAESRPDLDPLEAIKGFRKAREAGRLRAYHGDKGKGRFPVDLGAAIREHLDLLKAAELDAWLRESVGYGFPAHSPAPKPAEAAPAALPVPAAAPAPTVHSTKGRRPSDTLWPAIRKAQAQCTDPWDAADVYRRLEALAIAKDDCWPLIDATSDGILWGNKGTNAHLTRDALSKRLQGEKRRIAAAERR
jgi:hypothetical protein